MSFGAVIGLIALAEWQSTRRSDLPEPTSRFGRAWRKLRIYVFGALAVSAVATFATTPIAIYHFDRAAFYSLLANLLAEPVVAFIIMPAAAIAVILMPLGLELIPLRVMGWGVHAMTAIAHWVAGLPGATTMVRSWPVAALVIMILGGLWIALWRQKWRWLGLIPVAAAVLLIMFSSSPDLFIARDLRSAAFRGQDGRLIVVGERPDPYTATQWLIRDGDRRDLTAARSDTHCDEIGCVAFGLQGRVLAIARAVSALPEDCMRARIVISSLPLHGKCAGPELLVDRSDAARNGAMAVSFRSGHTVIETVASDRGSRPWVRRQ
jgi:competence protein ComEC